MRSVLMTPETEAMLIRKLMRQADEMERRRLVEANLDRCEAAWRFERALGEGRR